MLPPPSRVLARPWQGSELLHRLCPCGRGCLPHRGTGKSPQALDGPAVAAWRVLSHQGLGSSWAILGEQINDPGGGPQVACSLLWVTL